MNERDAGQVAESYRRGAVTFEVDEHRALPLNMAEVTPIWINSALRSRYPEVVVTGVQIDDVTYGTAARLRLELEYAPGRSAGLPPTMFLKSAFHDWRAHLAQVGVYENDARFYDEVQPLVDVHSPVAYFARWDPTVGEAGQFALLLEDLATRGCTFGRATSPVAPSQAAQVVIGMSGYHAPFWGGTGLERFPWLQTPLTRGLAGSFENLVEDVPGRLAQRGHAMPAALRDPDLLVAAFRRLREISAERRITFVHGDTHLGNFCFEPDGTPGQLDWQIVRAASFAHDLACFLGSALSIEDRRASEHDLVSTYLEALRARSIRYVPSFDEAFDLYRMHFVYGLYSWLINPGDMQNEDVNLTHVERHGTAMVDLGTIDALGL